MTSIRQEMDQLRRAIGEVEAIAAVTLEFYDGSDWSGFDQLLVGRVGHMLGVLATSATSAASKFERFETVFVDTRPVSAPVERWDDSKGTASGEAEAMSAEDAEIVRRIRERCPDNRFHGASDAELIQLFRRNKQVLGRSDDDVIAAMTHPR